MLRATGTVGINLLVLAVLLLGIEGCVRLVHPEIRPLGTDAELVADSVFGHAAGPRAGTSGYSNGALFRVTERGFWRYGTDADPADAAWLLLGDSVTMGVGVEPDRTFAGLLAKRAHDMTILNPSLIGYASDDYVDVLRAVADRTPGLRRVTVFWCLNDVYAGVPAMEDPDQRVRRALGPLLAFVHRHVFTYQWLKAALLDRQRTYYEHDAALYRGKAVDAAVGDVERIGDVCDREHLRCDVILIPYEYQLRAADRDSVWHPQEILKRRVNHSALSVYDPSAYLLSEARDPSGLFLYGDGIHLSEAGHRLMADFVSDLTR